MSFTFRVALLAGLCVMFLGVGADAQKQDQNKNPNQKQNQKQKPPTQTEETKEKEKAGPTGQLVAGQAASFCRCTNRPGVQRDD